MRSAAQKAAAALAKYRDRGNDALSALKAGRPEDANRLLKERDAAFHNFRAVDVLAQRAGDDVANDPAVLLVWADIRATELALATVYEALREEGDRVLSALRTARDKISQYRSRRTEDARFEKTA